MVSSPEDVHSTGMTHEQSAFLPAAQWRNNDGALAWATEALVSFYWSASANDANNAWYAGWEWYSTANANFNPGNNNRNRYEALPVRLVQVP